jgi:hypothetical protein
MKKLLLVLSLVACAHVQTSAVPDFDERPVAAVEEKPVLLASADVGTSVREWYASKLLQQPIDWMSPIFNTITVTGSGSSVFSGPLTAKSFTATAASGADAFKAVAGAHWHFSGGTNDYCSGDGANTVTCAPINTSTFSVFGGFNAGNSNFVVNGSTGAISLTGAATVGNTFIFASNTSLQLATMAMKNTAPTISSGFGTSPSIVASNGSLGFEVNVGTGGSATSGVIGLPTATNGWNCRCDDITTASATVFVTKQTASATTTCTVGNFNTSGVAAAWVASDKLRCIAVAY